MPLVSCLIFKVSRDFLARETKVETCSGFCSILVEFCLGLSLFQPVAILLFCKGLWALLPFSLFSFLDWLLGTRLLLPGTGCSVRMELQEKLSFTAMSIWAHSLTWSIAFLYWWKLKWLLVFKHIKHFGFVTDTPRYICCWNVFLLEKKRE